MGRSTFNCSKCWPPFIFSIFHFSRKYKSGFFYYSLYFPYFKQFQQSLVSVTKTEEKPFNVKSTCAMFLILFLASKFDVTTQNTCFYRYFFTSTIHLCLQLSFIICGFSHPWGLSRNVSSPDNEGLLIIPYTRIANATVWLVVVKSRVKRKQFWRVLLFFRSLCALAVTGVTGYFSRKLYASIYVYSGWW